MLNKFSFYLLIGFIYLSIEIVIKELKQYSQISVYDQSYIYLSVDGFAKKCKVHFELKYYVTFYSDNKISLQYSQSNLKLLFQVF